MYCIFYKVLYYVLPIALKGSQRLLCIRLSGFIIYKFDHIIYNGPLYSFFLMDEALYSRTILNRLTALQFHQVSSIRGTSK